MAGVISYAGIGSRKTPTEVLGKMRSAAKAMAGMGFVLRSGGADGADRAFEDGVDDFVSSSDVQSPDVLKEIFLPYRGFKSNQSPLYTVSRDARLMAKRYHPNWPNLGCVGRDFMGRNAYQIMGQTLDDPCDFVLCWTPGGKTVGGTGQALRHAADMEIPIFNFGTHSDDAISDFIFALNERKSG